MKTFLYRCISILILGLGIHFYSQSQVKDSSPSKDPEEIISKRAMAIIMPPRLRRMLTNRTDSLLANSKFSLSSRRRDNAPREWEPLRHQYGKVPLTSSEQTSSPSSKIALPLSAFNQSSSSASVNLAFLKYYASNLNPSVDNVRAIAVDDEGNIYITGETDSTLSFIDFMTIKYSPGGTQLWKRRYTSQVSHYDIPYALNVDNQRYLLHSFIGTFSVLIPPLRECAPAQSPSNMPDPMHRLASSLRERALFSILRTHRKASCFKILTSVAARSRHFA